jgi:hypothetical protein
MLTMIQLISAQLRPWSRRPQLARIADPPWYCRLTSQRYQKVFLYCNTVASASHDLDTMLLSLLKILSANTSVALDHAAVASRARPGVCLLQLNSSTK